MSPDPFAASVCANTFCLYSAVNLRRFGAGYHFRIRTGSLAPARDVSRYRIQYPRRLCRRAAKTVHRCHAESLSRPAH